MQTSMRAGLALSLAISGWIGLAPAAQAQGAAPIEIKVSVGVRDPIYSHLYIALSKKLLEAEGLKPTLTVTGSGSRSAQLLATGQVDILLGNPEHVVVIIKQGRPAAMLSAVDQRNTFGNIIVAKNSPAKTLADLKGKPIGVTATGGGAYYYANFMMQRSGVAAKDVEWLGLGAVNNILGGLKGGRIEAAVASLSMIETVTTEGYGRVLFDSRDTEAWNKVFGGPMPSSVVYALTPTIEGKADMVRRFVKGIAAADAWIHKSSAREIAEALLPDMGGQPIEAIQSAVDAYKKSYWRPQGTRIGQDEYKRWQAFLVANELLKAEEVGDFGYERLVKDVGAFAQ